MLLIRRVLPFAVQRVHMSLHPPSAELSAILTRYPGGAVRLERGDGHLGRLILDRPEKNNCLSGQMMLELRQRVEEIAAQPGDLAVVVVEGAGKSFCSGADLGLINELATPALGTAMFNFMADTLSALRNSPPLIVAKIHGHCLGGATEIATSCDLRLAHKDSKIGFMQAMMGIVPSWGGATWLEETVGRPTALKLMATAPLVTAVEAKASRWVDEIADSPEAAEAFLASLSKFSPVVVQAQKRMLAAVKIGGRAEEDLVIQSVWGAVDQKKAVEKQLNAIKNKK